MSTNFGTKDGILIRVMTLEDYKQVEGTVFNEIPLASFGGKDPENILKEYNSRKYCDHHIELIEQNTCLVAINEEDGGSIVGLVLAGCQVPADMERTRKSVREMKESPIKPIKEFMTEIKSKVNLFEHYEVPKLLYLEIIKVIPSMRGKGLGTRLTAALMELGQSKGFSLMAATCSSFYAERQMMAMGMECLYTRAFADYKDQNGQVVFNLPDPHTHVSVLATKLSL